MSTAARRRHFGKRVERYLLGPLLGSGGAASVYLARLDGPHGFERLCALKLVHEHLLGDRDLVNMILDEANLAVRLSHPGIVHSYELCQKDDFLFIAMEYLHGQPLARVYQRAQERGTPLPYELVTWIGARAAEALHYAHGLSDADGKPLGIVHRDVSPDNLFLTYDGEVKLIDFGIARAARRVSRTRLGEVKGKFRYMSAEYALGEEFDHRLDLFALGATLYEAALGVPAFAGELDSQVLAQVLAGAVREPRELRPDFPEALWAVLRRSLSASAEERFEDGESFARALASAVPCEPTRARSRLKGLLQGLFGAELASANAELAELRGLPRGPTELTTSHGQTLSLEPRPPSRSRLAPAAVALALVLGGAWLWRSRPAEQAAPRASDLAPAVAAQPSAPGASGSSTAPTATATASVDARELHAVSPRSTTSPKSSAAARPPPAATGLIKRYPF